MKTIKLPYKTNDDLTSILKQYLSVVRYSYNCFLGGNTEKDNEVKTKFKVFQQNSTSKSMVLNYVFYD